MFEYLELRLGFKKKWILKGKRRKNEARKKLRMKILEFLIKEVYVQEKDHRGKKTRRSLGLKENLSDYLD